MSEVVAPELLMAVPNVSDGRDPLLLEGIERAFAPARFLDIHADPDHDRSVFTLAAPQGELAEGLVSGARAIVEGIDITLHGGVHPHVGALDVMPVVYRSEDQRGPACAELLTAAARIGAELELPVVLYGELATRPRHRERAWLREGGPVALAQRIRDGDVVPDFGPANAHPTAGVALAAVRPPLVAFNVDLATRDLDAARRIAAAIRESDGGPGREGGRGLPGVRAIGLWLEQRGRAQVSCNVHDHRATPLREIVEAVRAEAPVAEAELVGLAPRAAFEGFPADVALRGFSADRHLLENALAALD
jgi:glutamate formiminotransferase/glutamate formiminotransferase/formiminotetrahydrofolate cyclodeaminase